MLQNIKSKIITILNLKRRFENFIREKEDNLLDHRKKVLLKFKENYPRFKKDLIKSIILGFFLFLGILILKTVYGMYIDVSLGPENVHSVIPRPLTDEEIEQELKKLIIKHSRRK